MVKSVNDAKTIALKINQLIKESDCYLEYQKYHQLIQKDTTLFKEEEALKQLQQKIVNATYHQSADLETLKLEYDKRMTAYELHPLVVNYLAAKSDLNEYLQYINQYINGALK